MIPSRSLSPRQVPQSRLFPVFFLFFFFFLWEIGVKWDFVCHSRAMPLLCARSVGGSWFFVYWSKLDHPTFNLSWEWNLKDRIVFGHVLCVGIGIGIFNNVYQCMYYAPITSKISFATVSGTQAKFFKQHFTERPCVWDLFFAQTPPFPFLDQASLLISGGRKKRGKGGFPSDTKAKVYLFGFHCKVGWATHK